MTDIKIMTTEELISRLEWASYYWGRTRSTGKHEAAGAHRKIANDSRAELERRIAEKKRAIDAGLERERELRETVSTLRDSLKSAEHSADRWQTRAESAETRVEELEGENALLEQEATADELRISRLTKERDAARAEVERLTEARGAWVRRAEAEAKQARVLESELIRLRTAVPRVIGTDVPRTIEPSEVREGQVVALRFDTIGDHPISEWLIQKADRFFSPSGLSPALGTIVLLADAPEDADDDFPCCRIKQTGICEDVG